jgi:hypothetical protein
VIGTIAVIGGRSAVPDGLIPFSTVILTEIFTAYVIVLAVAIVSESMAWTVERLPLMLEAEPAAARRHTSAITRKPRLPLRVCPHEERATHDNHYFCVSWLQLALLDLEISGCLKAIAVFVGALTISWILSAALRRAPGVRILTSEGGPAASPR